MSNVIDDFNRESLGIEVDFSLPAGCVIRSLGHIIEWHGNPSMLRCDDGPEYISLSLRARRGLYDKATQSLGRER